MGKRVQWLKPDQVDGIKKRTFDYVALFSPQKSKDKTDLNMTQEQIVEKYRKLEKKRQEKLKSEKLGFTCPGSVEKEFVKFRSRD